VLPTPQDATVVGPTPKGRGSARRPVPTKRNLKQEVPSAIVGELYALERQGVAARPDAACPFDGRRFAAMLTFYAKRVQAQTLAE
jgi:hypothetical protein